MLGISHWSVSSIPKDNLSMRRVAAKFATLLLGEDQNFVKTCQTKMTVVPQPSCSPYITRSQNGFPRTGRKTRIIGRMMRKAVANAALRHKLVAAYAVTSVQTTRQSQSKGKFLITWCKRIRDKCKVYNFAI